MSQLQISNSYRAEIIGDTVVFQFSVYLRMIDFFSEEVLHNIIKTNNNFLFQNKCKAWEHTLNSDHIQY